MVNMSKRSAYDDSDDSSSGDDSDGNWKRRRRNSDDDDFVTKTLNSFQEPQPSKPLRVVNTRPDILATKQKQAEKKISKLTSYEDIFDGPPQTEEVEIKPTTSKACLSKTQIIVNDVKPCEDKRDCNGNAVEKSSDSESAEEVKPKPDPPVSSDPRLKRLDRFKALDPSQTAKNYTPPPLKERINQLLNNRKPMEAYSALKGEIAVTEHYKYRDQLLVMAKDWFPSLIDSAFDPRNIFIEAPTLNSFQNLIKDIFNLKVKSKEFWESIISSIDKFIRESRIVSLSAMILKLRWILIQDIREYLIEHNIKIGIKNTDFLVDQRIRLNANRERHRRQVEENYQMTAKPMTAPPVQMPVPVPVIPAIPKKRANPMVQSMPSISESIPPIEEQMDVEPPIVFTSVFANSQNRRIKDQIYECLINDQIIKFIGMLDRHTLNKNYDFVDHFGDTLMTFHSQYPNKPVKDIFLKLHSFLKLEANRFQPNGLLVTDVSKNRLKTLFERILQQFHRTLCYQPKEWLSIREHSVSDQCKEHPCREQHFHVEHNPFNEPLIPIKHNVFVDCGYTNASKALVVNYNAFEEQISLGIGNVILKDPRKELPSPAVSFTSLKETPVAVVVANGSGSGSDQVIPAVTAVTNTIRIPNSNSQFNETELKTIVRRVVLSSSESEEEEE